MRIEIKQPTPPNQIRKNLNSGTVFSYAYLYSGCKFIASKEEPYFKDVALGVSFDVTTCSLSEVESEVCIYGQATFVND